MAAENRETSLEYQPNSLFARANGKVFYRMGICYGFVETELQFWPLFM